MTRFLLEGCIEIGLSAMICALMIQKENFYNFWELISTVLAFVSLFCLAIAPFLFFKITKKYLETVEQNGDPNSSPYVKLFNNYHANQRSLRYPSIFFLRRYLMLLMLTLLL